MLDACPKYQDWHGQSNQENAHRLQAFILLLRYSGLRVSDAASCAVDRLAGNRLFLYTQKTGVPVDVPLPPFVVEALNACPRLSPRYWFWTGIGSKETFSGNWRRSFRRLCKIASVDDGHPHRFRDTLAVELLIDGMPIERVSILLGHSSVKITERHYSPWVQALQAQLEADLAHVWRNHPIAQAEQLRCDTALPSTPSQRMIATPQRQRQLMANRYFRMVSRAGLGHIEGIDRIQVIESSNGTNRSTLWKSRVCHHSVTTEINGSGFACTWRHDAG